MHIGHEQLGLSDAACRLNQELRLALIDFQQHRERGVDLLSELFDRLGIELNGDKYSLICQLRTASLSPMVQQKLRNWNIDISCDTIVLALAPPFRGSTGTHGSGERQKIMEAVQTMTIQYDAQENPIVAINLFGRFTGLYYRLVEALSLTVGSEQIVSLSIVPTVEWKKMLAQCANSVVQTSTKGWPEFVFKQLRELDILLTPD